MKELSATLMLQPFNFSTMSDRSYDYAKEGFLKEHPFVGFL